MIRNALREILLIAACVILTGTVALIVVDTVIMPKVVRKALQVEVPDIVDLTPSQARAQLGRRGLRLELREPRWDDSILNGRLVFQSPPAFSRVKPNRTVYAIPSKGVQLHTVPDMRKKTLRQAQLQLTQAGLLLGEVRKEPHPVIKEDAIVYHEPAPGQEVEYGTPVVLIVSDGPVRAIVIIPNVVGKRLEDARKTLSAADLPVKDIRYAFSTAYVPNTVIGQVPKAGEEAKQGTPIRLVVSKL